MDYDDGDSAEYAGHELAPLLEVSEEDFYDPRRWHYDFSVMHPMDIPAFRRALFSFVSGFGFDLPAAWGAPRSRAEISAVLADAGEPASEPAGVEAFLAAEAAHLAGLVGGFLGTARAERTFANLRNPAIKLIWFLASRGCALPPTANEVAAYYAKVAEISNTVGGVAMAKSALSMLCVFNDVSTVAYSSMRVNAALESMRRSHRHQVRKAAGLTVDMVAAILDGYCFVRPGRPAELQWELMIGACIGIGFKLLLRYDDLKRCRWDDDFCDVFPTHVRFYLDGRKNNQYGGNFLDVARPRDEAVLGVYHVCVLAKSIFRRGYVLGSVDASGRVDVTKPMPHKVFVAHLREALVNIGLSREMASVYSAHSMRAGGATAAAVHGLHREEIQHLAGVADPNWLAYYNRNYLAERLRVSQAIGL